MKLNKAIYSVIVLAVSLMIKWAVTPIAALTSNATIVGQLENSNAAAYQAQQLGTGGMIVNGVITLITAIILVYIWKKKDKE